MYKEQILSSDRFCLDSLIVDRDAEVEISGGENSSFTKIDVFFSESRIDLLFLSLPCLDRTQYLLCLYMSKSCEATNVQSSI